MKKGVFRLCAGLLAAILLSVLVVPCYAESDKYTSTGTFWQAVADKWYFNGTVIPAIIGTVSDEVCSESGDKKHHGSLKSYEQNPDKSYTAICDFCSAEFLVYDADLSAAYDSYVATLPASGYTSSGSFLWQPTVNDIKYPCVLQSVSSSSSIRVSVLPYRSGSSEKYFLISSTAGGTGFHYTSSVSSSCFYVRFPTGPDVFSFIAPVSGSYRYGKTVCSYSILLTSGTRLVDTVTAGGTAFVHVASGGCLSRVERSGKQKSFRQDLDGNFFAALDG